MAFSFNWAGLTAPQVSLGQEADLNVVGKNLGTALRGYRNREAAEEYADKIDAYRTGRGAKDSRVEQIKAEIARLESENKQLESLLGETPPPLQFKPSVVSEEDVKNFELSTFNPDDAYQKFITGKSTPEDIELAKKIQTYLNVDADGKFGKNSLAAYNAWLNSYNGGI